MTKKIKILQVIRPAAGGMKEHVLSLINNLDKFKYEVLAACPADSPTYQDLQRDGIKVFPININGELSLRGDWQSISQLTQIIRKEEIAIVHSHGSKAGLVARIAAKRAGAKNVFTVHGTIFHEHFSPIKKKIFAKVEGVLAGLTHKIITVSKSLKDDLIQLEGVDTSKIAVIYNGVPTKKFNLNIDRDQKRADLDLKVTPKLIVTVARLASQKGLQYLLDAVESIENQDFQLAIVGDGPLLAELSQQAKDLKITDKVKFLGHRHDVPEILKAADIFVLSSITEGLPLIVLEAMAAQLPVISTIVGGVPEIIENEINGLLVKPKVPEELKIAIEKLLLNNELARKIAGRGYETVTNEFDLEIMVNKISQVYDELV